MNYIHGKEEMDDTKIREIQWMAYLRYNQAFGSRTSPPGKGMKEYGQPSRGPNQYKLEGNVLRNLRPTIFQMLMCKILHI